MVPRFMALILPALAVTFAAFCVWLTVRIVNRREPWAKRTIAFVSIAIVGLYFLSHPWACAFIARGRLVGSPVYHAVQLFYVPCGWAYGALPESIQSRYWPYYNWSLTVCGVEPEPE